MTSLQFSPIVKRKNFRFSEKEPTSLVTVSEGKIFTGIFTGFSVEIIEPNDIKLIYENGCFGKGSKSRGSPEIVRKNRTSTNQENSSKEEENIKESLVLDLEEAFYLNSYLKLLRIVNLVDKEMEWKDILKEFEKIKPNFLECFSGYLYFRSKNWIVKSGMKFGGTFLLYKSGPRYHHASFVVHVANKFNDNETHRSAKDLQGLQRIAETSDKDILILEVTRSPVINSIEDFNNFTVSETIIRRFNYTAFVSQN